MISTLLISNRAERTDLQVQDNLAKLTSWAWVWNRVWLVMANLMPASHNDSHLCIFNAWPGPRQQEKLQYTSVQVHRPRDKARILVVLDQFWAVHCPWCILSPRPSTSSKLDKHTRSNFIAVDCEGPKFLKLQGLRSLPASDYLKPLSDLATRRESHHLKDRAG